MVHQHLRVQPPCLFEVPICLKQFVCVLLQLLKVLLTVLQVAARVDLAALERLNNLSFNDVRGLSIAPAAKVAFAIIGLVNAKAVLLVVEPGSEISAFVFVRVNAIPMFVVLLKKALILP